MASLGETIKVQGIALVSGVSRNNVMYTSDEMRKTAHELTNKPILMDHESKSNGVIGKTTSSKFLPNENAIQYEGWIKETGHGIVEAIKDGRLETVSIGAMCEELLQEDDSPQMMARGIHYLELSTTPTPGVEGTSLHQSLSTISGITEHVSHFRKFQESATDTSKPLMSDRKAGTIPEINKLRIRCPMKSCDVSFSDTKSFENHVMTNHKWSDSEADEFLRQMGVVDSDEEAGEDVDNGRNLGADIASKNEQPVKLSGDKKPNEKVKIKTEEKRMVEIQEKKLKSALPEDDMKKQVPAVDANPKSEDEEEEALVDGEDEDETEENPAAYKGDSPQDKGYADKGFAPKPKGAPSRGAPYGQVSANAKKENFNKQLQARDMLISNLTEQLSSLKGDFTEMKKTQETKINEKGLVNVREVYSGNDKTYEVDSIRFERLDNGKFALWKMPNGPKGQYIKQ